MDWKSKLKSLSIETRDKNLQKVKNRLVSDILEVNKQDKLKISSKSGKIEISNKTQSKLDTQKTAEKSFSTPVSKSEVENFIKDVTKNSLESPGDIGKGGSTQVKDFLKDKLNTSMDSLVDKAKNKSLEEVNHLINRKLSKGQSLVSNVLQSILSGNPNIGNNNNRNNNPVVKQAIKSYETKPQVLSFGTISDEPKIIFQVADIDKPDTVTMLTNSQRKQTVADKIIHIAKLPALPGGLNTPYSFNYQAKDKPLFAEGGLQTAGLKKLFEGTKIGESVAQAGKIAVNPNQEQVFTSVDFRNLTFEYVFLPKNETEHQLIDNIIFMFKYWSHPNSITWDKAKDLLSSKITDEDFRGQVNSIKTGNAKIKLLQYPRQWEIKYDDGSGGSSGVSFKTKKCYCTKLEVSYGSSEGLLLFEKTSKPTMIRLNMSFTEGEYILREDIMEGF